MTPDPCTACEGFEVVTWPHAKGSSPVTVVAACTCTGLGWSVVVRQPTPAKVEEAIARLRERVLAR
jgi:hypothetical protein